jgi:ribonuclease-3
VSIKVASTLKRLSLSTLDNSPAPGAGLFADLGVELDSEVLVLALTHRSFAHENGGIPTNERLEFLGDAVLGLLIAELLFREYPDRPEGELSAMRASIVSQRPLAEVGRHLGVSRYLLLGKGEQRTGGAKKDSILSDAVEALIGATYLQHGFDVTRQTVYRLLEPQIIAAGQVGAGADWKANLHDRAISLGYLTPEYSVTWTGPDHARRYFVEVLAGQVVARGEGSSKKHAEQAAAESAFHLLPEISAA